MHPIHVDGRALVILRQTGRRFDVIASGRLAYDGESLTLRDTDGGERTISDAELDGFQPVVATNRIRECQGFDLYLLVD
jgi:hypothetical protein